MHQTFRGASKEAFVMLTLSMIVLGLVTFAAMLGLVALCDRV